MSEPEEDFAAMFAASTQARQFDKGQTIEGTHRRHRAGGGVRRRRRQGRSGRRHRRAEERRRRHRSCGRRSHPGDRRVDSRRVDALPQAGPRPRHRSTADRRVPLGAAGRGQGRAHGQGRIRSAARPPARLLPLLADRHRADRRSRVARRPRLRVPHHRVQGGRPEPDHLAPEGARGGAAGARRRGPRSRSCQAPC